MASIKKILLVHPKYGELINETFVDETQFKIFLKMIHTALALGNDFTTYNGKDFLIHVPNIMLKQSLVLGNTKEMSMSDVVIAKSKLEG